MILSILWQICLVGLAAADTTIVNVVTKTNIATKTIVHSSLVTASHPAGATATDVKWDIGFNYNNEVLKIPNLPNKSKLTCKTCQARGTLEFASGGYDPDDGILIPAEILTNGFLKFVAHGVSANFTMELDMDPGFSIGGFMLPLFKRHLFRANVAKLGYIDIYFGVVIPVSLTLYSKVEIFPSLTLNIPDGSTFYLDIGDNGNSWSQGFNRTTITPSLSFHAPDLSFDLTTGLQYVVGADLQVGNDKSDVQFGGNVSAALDLPLISMHATKKTNVNTSCDTPRSGDKTYDSAVKIDYYATASLNISIDLMEDFMMTGKQTWSPPDLQVFKETMHFASSCSQYDPKAQTLIGASAKHIGDENSAAPAQLAPRRGASIAGLIAFMSILVMT